MATTPTDPPPCDQPDCPTQPGPADWIVGVSIDEIYGHYQYACHRHVADAATTILELIGADPEVNGRLQLQATRYLS